MTDITHELEDELMHIGILHKSGRYPWGSGDNPNQRNKAFLDYVNAQSRKGMSEVEIARGAGITTAQLRAAKTIAKTAERAELQSKAQRLKDAGHSNIAIGKEIGVGESRVRDLLRDGAKEKNDKLQSTANMLKTELADKGYVDIGSGVEHYAMGGISRTQLLNSVALLKEEGYETSYVKVPQATGKGETTVMVLRRPDIEWKTVVQNPDKIGSITAFSPDNGRSWDHIDPPLSISSKRIEVRYGPDGGADMDGVIQIRRGVDDLSIGKAQYAQGRIMVDNSHYLKGMVMYTDDLPDGVDIRFNTNKTDKGDKLKAMKPLKELEEGETNPFGAVVRQIKDKPGPDGKVTSGINIVNEEGDWNEWSKSISTQVLSKQPSALAKKQLDLRHAEKVQELDEILALNNPAVKKRLLESYSDDLDSSADKLKAAALPRQRTQVILPVNSLSDNEIYAPNFRNGERVVLIRYPHGGKFEIPELTVNNRNREANSVIKNAIDAVGINSSVASRLSGADFDGDTVLVIPNNSRSIKTEKPLAGLKGFDPQSSYPAFDGMKTIDGGTWNAARGKPDFPPDKEPSGRTKQIEMGKVSNLITDMTIRGASHSELERAVRHSMVVIDAEKHSLNYTQSAKDNGIAQLKTKYQGKSNSGATTLISQASSRIEINERRLARVGEGGPIDPVTGRKRYVDTGNGYTTRGKDGTGPEVFIPKKTKVTRMSLVDDAHLLSSGTPIENIYANHANRTKALANRARVELIKTKPMKQSISAKQTYGPEIASLASKLRLAKQNAPRERQAQLAAAATLKAKQQANPGMSPDQVKKTKRLALAEARTRFNANKPQIVIEPKEWDAIQAGAISNNVLTQILSNADLNRVKELATPRDRPVMTSAKTARAKAMAASGFTPAEIADTLGVAVSTLHDVLK